MMTSDGEKAAEVLGRAGRLRVAVNFGNSVLARHDRATGEPRGISVDLAEELATRLKLEAAYTTFEAARSVVEALRLGECELAFLAIDPLRGEYLSYTRPYVIIEGGYLAKASAPFAAVDDVDRKGVTIAVGSNAAYDLYLTRTLKNATLKRAPTSSGAVELFLAEELDLAAGIKSALLTLAGNRPDLTVLDGTFMEIRQAIAVPRSMTAAVPWLDRFVAEALTSGFIRERLEAHGQDPRAAASH